MIRLAFLILPFLLSTAAWAAEPAALKVELNKLEPTQGACRAYLVLENRTGQAFSALKLDLVMFDSEGVVARRLAVDTAPLPAGKTSLRVFDIEGLTCERLGRVLLNEVMSCVDGSGSRDDCLAMIAPATRGTVAFVK